MGIRSKKLLTKTHLNHLISPSKDWYCKSISKLRTNSRKSLFVFYSHFANAPSFIFPPTTLKPLCVVLCIFKVALSFPDFVFLTEFDVVLPCIRAATAAMVIGNRTIKNPTLEMIES